MRTVSPTANHHRLRKPILYTDIRRHPAIASDFPLLVQAASWTGSIANQNRGTLGGNIVNGSPAADSPPALLAYDATLTLISAAGTRTMPYSMFHLSYKKSALAPDELLFSIALPRKLHWLSDLHPQSRPSQRPGHLQRSPSPALALVSKTQPRIIKQVRIGAASLRETPARCTATEATLLNQPITPQTIAAARASLIAEARPIDDIRSTARYRAAIAANLLEEFLQYLQDN